MNGGGAVIIDMPTDLQSRPSPLHLDDTPSTSLFPGGITALTVDTPTSAQFNHRRADPSLPKARWRTPEFIFYAIVFLLVVPCMVWTPYNLSRSSHPNFPKYVRRISKGWIFGRGVDNSDAQYRSFRSNIPALLALSLSHLICGKLYNFFFMPSGSRDNLHSVPFHSGFAILMIFALHGASALKVLAILFINYTLSKSTVKYGVIGPTVGWMFNILILFLNEWYEGYQFGILHSSLSALDTIQGFYPRWHVSFNVTTLRLISFYMDHYWAYKNTLEVQDIQTAMLSEKQRSVVSHDMRLYSFWNYLAYALYSPLYIGGPIMTFNDFMWQLRRPITPSSSTVISYAIRFLFCFFTMELVLHYIYVVAIKDSGAWVGDSPFELSMIGFWNLTIVWLKLLIFWRFFRLWALADGIDPPENMVRCMANNYSTLAFWRSWHRSYNLWLLRYIYIPCGGARNMIPATALVFTFVALWHDLSLKLLVWGWLVTLFILPEVLARWAVPASKYSTKWWYRHVGATGAVVNILMMMTANLIGFVIGTDGMRYMANQLIGTAQGIRFMLSACICIFIAVQVMFEYREEERRRGIYRKY